MVELRLKYKDPSGDEREIAVDAARFFVGRHSECDLSIADGRLSREHLLIERFGDVFVITDKGSSNGTILNEEPLDEPKAIKDGDKVELGGFEIEILIVDDQGGAEDAAQPEPLPNAAPPIAAATSVASSDSGIAKSIFIVAPVMGVLILVALGVIIFVTSGRKTPVDNSNFIYTIDPEETPKLRKTPESGSSPVNGGGTETPTTAPTPTDPGNTPAVPTPANLDDTGKTEANAAAFLRKAAANDPKAFVTGAQAQIVNAKIKSLAGSSALASNISSARKNAAAIKSLAASKNLKPQFLAVAAITKLGGSSGDVLSTAQSMADTLDKLAVQVGNELGDDCLLMMAAYDQGDPMKMRNMLQDLANKSSESSRTIRTIWFLQKNGKITPTEYDLALRFLAVGTIAQNPRDFGVNTDGLAF